MPRKRSICFVIMPFSKTSDEHTEEYWTSHFDTFLKPLIEEGNELEARRSEPLRGDILRQIITALVDSPVVVADLTDNNPNVNWELGVRQSFKHGTVTIAQDGTKIPFDLSVKGVLFYCPKDHIKNAAFERKFKKAMQDCLFHPEIPDSHVLETISGRGTLFQIIHRDESIRRVEALISECERDVKVLNDVFKLAEYNQSNPKKRRYATKRLRISAVELLVTTRYLDEGTQFYRLAEKSFSDLFGINEILSTWRITPHVVDKFFLKPNNQEILQTNLRKLLDKLAQVQKKLAASR